MKQQAAQRGAIVREFYTRRNVLTWAIYISGTGRAIEMFKGILKLSGYCKYFFVSVKVLNLTLKESKLSF